MCDSLLTLYSTRMLMNFLSDTIKHANLVHIAGPLLGATTFTYRDASLNIARQWLLRARWVTRDMARCSFRVCRGY